MNLQALSLDQALLTGAGLMLDGILALCAVFVIFALIDLPVQHMIFMREQRMSKRELKEEHKTSEGRPEVRQRIRQLQQQMARRSVRKLVPDANVVIVNPEHYAVALKYDETRADAPFVIAKGVDEMALYIGRIAREHEVEVVPLPPLARAIYNTSQVNQKIPAPLYKAVAVVLSYVLQLKAFRSGQRRAEPQLPESLPISAQFLNAYS
ncbi:EscU/YscU/HrcU family type III secretion system export apparatus switch protein [Candidatus Dactylopiibacterium carminicum]|uniref:EscU/YscU/HrcU family type III secretion system export apparatus switch protein n=1 Tax=Candidatus Dactylopiibacterium carminicum TaxID=857335 RepID=UPI0021E0BA6E|nr:EscU/YscU/HrcU family type III secretion system export apparatus switch protein [Candidatus Dactylopiibacterium carminicum]